MTWQSRGCAFLIIDLIVHITHTQIINFPGRNAEICNEFHFFLSGQLPGKYFPSDNLFLSLSSDLCMLQTTVTLMSCYSRVKLSADFRSASIGVITPITAYSCPGPKSQQDSTYPSAGTVVCREYTTWELEVKTWQPLYKRASIAQLGHKTGKTSSHCTLKKALLKNRISTSWTTGTTQHTVQ